VQSSLEEFRESPSSDAFTQQNSKLLKVRLEAVTIQAKLGSMVAYQGDVRFEHAGAGGVGRFIKKAVTGEGAQLMKVSGTGEVFLAHQAEDVHLLKLENDSITCNGSNLLAFEDGIDWDIRRVEGAGAMSGGLYNLTLNGTGWAALLSDGPPVLLDAGQAPTFCDPQAAIAWSGGLKTQVKTDVNLKSLLGRGSGETFQMGFSGTGWVLVQPSEGRVAAPATGSSSGGGGGLLGNLGN
jgi:uncharacterized protein (AIM24 family)